MRVLLFSLADCAGQNHLLAEAMKEHLDWDAKTLTCAKTYMNYPSDWFVGVEEDKKEALEFAEDADLLIYQDLLIEPENLGLRKMASPENTIIYGLGSLMRENIQDVINYVRAGWHVLPPISDPTITRYVGGAPFEAIIVDPRVDELTKGVKRNKKTTVITGQTKEDLKGLDKMKTEMKKMKNVQFVSTGQGHTWEEHQKIKAKAHVMLDSLGDSSYGLNCLEALVMGQQVVSNINPWCYALHPDLPMHSLHGNDLIEVVKNAIEMAENYDGDFKLDANVWVSRHFAPSVVAEKWEHYIEYAIEKVN